MVNIDELKKKYSRTLPPSLMTNMINNTQSWCRLNPIGCFQQVLTETAFILVAYSSIIFLFGGKSPEFMNIFKFILMFGLFSLGARMISDTFSDKLQAAALAGLGLKITSLLVTSATGRYVSW